MTPDRRERLRWIKLAVTLVLLAGAIAVCLGRRAPAPLAAAVPPRTSSAQPTPMEPRTFLPAAPRMAAIGDLHGDLEATRAALRLAGAIDGGDRWIGGELVVVQVGDAIDRGDDDRAILDLFSRLEIEAAEAGGAFRPLVGNHELMNVAGELRFVSAAGMTAFDDLVASLLGDPALGAFPPLQRGRAAAFRPGGPVAAAFARRSVVAVVGDTAFVHAGLLPEHVAYGVERINREVRAFLRGERPALPPIMDKPRSPVWTRLYSEDETPSAETCAALGAALAALGAERMVVGHTVQPQGINAACGGRVWRIDTGMSAAYEGGPIQILELAGDRVAPLAAEPR
jgi:hypothetical protein